MSNSIHDENYLDKYIDLIIRRGVNIQKGQELLITSPVDCAFFARKAVNAAYEAGASNVHLRWTDDACLRSFYFMADDGVFDAIPEWNSLMLNSLSERGCAFLSISASDPEALKGADPDRLSRYSRALNKAVSPYWERMMSGFSRWCIASIPSKPWAEKVFPDLLDSEAEERLWSEIFAACRIDEGDPVENWQIHIDAMNRRVEALNRYEFKSLRLKNSAGTDLVVDLPKNHVWAGGTVNAQDGVPFLPNIPTEEIFTAPHRNGVNGTVVSTMPNVYHGDIIDNFSITFKDGKVVSYKAEKGQALLERMISDTPNMDRIGEIALVPHDSPISQTGILFYNTLFDENASCHLALGRAYPESIKGGAEMSAEEMEKAGINISDDHHDFMFGSADMEITGITGDGKEIAVFREGNFLI